MFMADGFHCLPTCSPVPIVCRVKAEPGIGRCTASVISFARLVMLSFLKILLRCAFTGKGLFLYVRHAGANFLVERTPTTYGISKISVTDLFARRPALMNTIKICDTQENH